MWMCTSPKDLPTSLTACLLVKLQSLAGTAMFAMLWLPVVSGAGSSCMDQEAFRQEASVSKPTTRGVSRLSRLLPRSTVVLARSVVQALTSQICCLALALVDCHLQQVGKQLVSLTGNWHHMICTVEHWHRCSGVEYCSSPVHSCLHRSACWLTSYRTTCFVKHLGSLW
jgi:hypothetical protein